MKWYVLKVKPGLEKKTLSLLKRAFTSKGIERHKLYLPTEKKLIISVKGIETLRLSIEKEAETEVRAGPYKLRVGKETRFTEGSLSSTSYSFLPRGFKNSSQTYSSTT